MKPKVPKKPKNVRLNILRTYAVHWDEQTFVRDVLQNFFDASNDFEGVTIAIEREGGVVRIEGPQRFDFDYVKYIGGTTKAEGRSAGQFGEGFKVCALVALRDFGLHVLAGAGKWRIEPAFVKVRIGEELVYRYSTEDDHPGSFLELRGCSRELLARFAEGKRFFRWPGNASFGECLFSDGDVHVYRTKRSCGELYYGKQLRGEIPFWPFTLCLDRTLKSIRRDRDRRKLTASQVRVVIGEVGGRLPFAVGMHIVHELKSNWQYAGLNMAPFIQGLCRAHRETYKDGWPNSFPESWVAAEDGSTWQHANAHARRIGLQVAQSCLATIGMRRAREAWISTVHPVEESELTVVHRARRELLLAGGRLIYRGTHPPTRFARMEKENGEYRASEIVLQFALLEGNFAEALSTYVHELCHEAGRDGDARFSDALTLALELAVTLHWRLADLDLCWTKIKALATASVEDALREPDATRRVDLLVELAAEHRQRNQERFEALRQRRSLLGVKDKT